MQLIYLYIENYKNIENEGFSFSGKYTCSFDGQNLTIDENENYKNIFSDNVNMTAIVGKNGSGKSSIFKIILMIIFYNYFKNTDTFKDEIKLVRQKIGNNRLFLVIKINTKFYKLGINIENNLNNIKEYQINNIEFFTMYLNYMIDTLYDDFEDFWINKLYHKNDDYNTPLLIQPNKHDKDTLNDVINLYMIDFLYKQKILLLYKYINTNQQITSFFNPNAIKIKNVFIDNFRVNMKNPNGINISIIKKIANKLTYLLYIYQFNYDLDNNKIPKQFKNIEDNKDYRYMNLLYLFFKILSIKNIDNLFIAKEYKKLKRYVFCCIKKNQLPKKEILIKFNIQNMFKTFDEDNYKLKKILISLNFELNKVYENIYYKKLLNEEKVNLKDIQDILEYLPLWIDIEFYDNNKSFESLSSGEKALFRIIIDLIYQVKNIEKHYNSINLFLDETELGLHPQWQKRYLKDILDSINKIVKKDFVVNIILSTHSPFILSDIPKENIIFLKDGENVSDEVDINTFGANIHTLLSHGFFMEDGLMGEFAKDKINEVIKFLNNKDNNIQDKDEAKNIINMIGEPFVKEKLLQMYLEKFQDESIVDEEIDKLEQKLKRLQDVKAKF
jgi:ABC-type multidrug transport system ATPase subunit